MSGLEDRLAPYIGLWRLEPDGDVFETSSSVLQPVRMHGAAAMLKLISSADEENGPAALEYFAGDGAVALLARMGWAQVTARASGGVTLLELVQADDDAAFSIICNVLARLHGARDTPPPRALVSLHERFSSLFKMRAHSPAFEQAALIAEDLLAAPEREGVLHGDMHHENVIWDAERGWLAIDPKGVFGERTYDYANALLNPIALPALVRQPGRLARQAQIVSARIGAPPRRVLAFAAAHAGLGTAWSLEDGHGRDMSVLNMALETLAQARA
jgi:streptomycin 6-kinase